MTSSVKKCILKNDHQSLISLDAFSSVKQETIKVATGNLPENISCPPKPLKSENDNQMLSDVGIALTSSSGIMMRIVVPADNSCLFTSLYFITHAGQVNVTEVSKLRKVVARGIKQRPEKYNRAILGISNEEYQKWILDSASWGGEIELEVISASFRLEICAIDIIRCQMHRFGESYNYSTRCFLVHDGIHYDPLVMQYEDRMETLFTCRDNHVIDLAMEVAKEAQSSRQFTDTQNFKLRCMVCGERLIGNKEASAHAKTTGHANCEELKS